MVPWGMRPLPALTKDVIALAGAFLVSGVVHLVRPQVFEPAIPRRLPAAKRLVHVSGVAEIACAVALFVPATRRYAGWASAALLLAVWPANAQMLLTAHHRAQRDPADSRKQMERVVMLARLPLQIPLIRIALRAAGRV